MANEQNLIKSSDLTPSQRRENASKAGKASAEAKKKRKALKEQLEILLALPVKSKELKTKIKSLGIEDEEINNQMAMTIALYQEALKGNTKAVEIIRDTIGEKPQDNVKISGELNNPFEGLSTEELRKILNE